MPDCPEIIEIEVPAEIEAIEIEVEAEIDVLEVEVPGEQGPPGTRITASIEDEPPVDPRPGDFWIVLPNPPP